VPRNPLYQLGLSVPAIRVTPNLIPAEDRLSANVNGRSIMHFDFDE
jgi:hypothetical protein